MKEIKKEKKTFLMYKLSIIFTLLPFISTTFFIAIFFVINVFLDLINNDVLEFGIETSQQKLFVFSLVACLLINIVFIINTYIKYKSFKLILRSDSVEISDVYPENILIKNIVYAESKRNIFDIIFGFSSTYIYQKNQNLRIIRFLPSKNTLSTKINKLVDSRNNFYI